MNKKNIAVIITCYNRREKTLSCIRNVYEQSALSDGSANAEIFLMDDGSTDGTSESVQAEFPQVHLYHGSGSLFWNKGMHAAWEKAIEQGGFDYYLMLNDDTFLYRDAFASLLDAHRIQTEKGKEKTVIAGSTTDPRNGKLSYGGYVRSGSWNPMNVVLQEPGDEPIEVYTICGNCVLIPESVVERIGNLDPVFAHRWGDSDYGRRAWKGGCRVAICQGYIGECDFNENSEAWTDTSHSIRKRIEILHSMKGLHKEDWRIYTRRHAGFVWPLAWLSPYIKIVLTSLLAKRVKPKQEYEF